LAALPRKRASSWNDEQETVRESASRYRDRHPPHAGAADLDILPAEMPGRAHHRDSQLRQDRGESALLVARQHSEFRSGATVTGAAIGDDDLRRAAAGRSGAESGCAAPAGSIAVINNPIASFLS